MHFLALDLKELEIAEAARQKAEDLYSTESGIIIIFKAVEPTEY